MIGKLKGSLFQLNTTLYQNFTPQIQQKKSIRSWYFKFSTKTSQQSSITEQLEENYIESGQNDLRQLSQVIFPTLDRYGYKDIILIFKRYSHAGLLDAYTYKTIEKVFLKNLKKMTNSELMEIISNFQHYPGISDNLLLMIQHKIFTEISQFEPQDIYRISQVFTGIGKGSLKFHNTLHSYFINRMKEYTRYQSLRMLISIIDQQKAQYIYIKDTIDFVFLKIRNDFEQMQKTEFILALYCYFGDYLHKNLLEIQKIQGARDTLNQIMYGGGAINTEKGGEQNSKAFHDSRGYINYFQKLQPTILLQTYTLMEKNNLDLKELLIVLEVFLTSSDNFPSQFLDYANLFVSKNLDLVLPQQILKFASIALSNKLCSLYPDIAKQCTLNLKNYANTHLKNFSNSEINDFLMFDKIHNIGLFKIFQQRLEQTINSVNFEELIQITQSLTRENEVEPVQFIQKYVFPALVKEMKFENRSSQYLIPALQNIYALKLIENQEVAQDFFTALERNIIIENFNHFQLIYGFIRSIEQQNPEYQEITRNSLLQLQFKYSPKTDIAQSSNN